MNIYGRLKQACVKKLCIRKFPHVTKKDKQKTVGKGGNNRGTTKLRARKTSGNHLKVGNEMTSCLGEGNKEKVVSILLDFYRTRVWSLALLVTIKHWLIDSLTNSCLVDLIDVGLACEDGNSKLVEDVDDEKQFNFIW